MVMATLTPLCARNEIYHWDNRPFLSSWPEPIKIEGSQGAEIKKTIKKKTKRIRTSFTTEQLKYLEDTFINKPYINTEERLQLAKAMKIGEKQIKVWFQNRRMKEKRRSTEMSETYSEISTPSPSSYNKNEFEYAVEINDPNNTYFGVPVENTATQINYGEVTDYEVPLQTYNISNAHNAAFVDFFDVQYANNYNYATNLNYDMNAGSFHTITADYNFAHNYNVNYYNSLQNNGYIYDFTVLP